MAFEKRFTQHLNIICQMDHCQKPLFIGIAEAKALLHSLRQYIKQDLLQGTDKNGTPMCRKAHLKPGGHITTYRINRHCRAF